MSSFNLLTNTLAIGVPNVCRFNSEGAMSLMKWSFDSTFMGTKEWDMLLNRVATKNSSLPYFLKSDCHLNTGSAESIAQFLSKYIFYF